MPIDTGIGALTPVYCEVPAGADLLVILDNADQAGDLGYHDETPDGKPYARAFVTPILDQGGKPLRTDMSVSACVSHEVCEWFGDPYVNLWADDGGRKEYAVELCDPVENDSYEIDHVAVSNFVTKRYFDHLAPKGSRFDYLKKLKKPYSMTPGGYLLIRHGTNVQEKDGARYPNWKKEMKRFPASRTAKRLKQTD